MTAKEKLFKVMDRIDEEQNELDTLEVKKMQYWSEWKY